MEVTNKVAALVYKTISELKAFQGNLKDLPMDEYEKLKNSLLVNGNIAPLFIWQNNILDGHQRVYTLLELEKAGVKIPTKIPCVEIQASSNKQAKKFILQYISQHGSVEKQGLYDFLVDAEIDTDWDDLVQEIKIPNLDTEKFTSEFFENIKVDEDQTENNQTENKKTITCPECGHSF